MNVIDFLNYRMEKTAGIQRLMRLEKSKKPGALRALKTQKAATQRRIDKLAPGLGLGPYKQIQNIQRASSPKNVQRTIDKMDKGGFFS